ncbi:multicopper oxidase domain-containing protein [Candidatus Gracilibacteria bacterium]|nr:multicopper oxidase domain-containing protein [Candidatus Gracilibacteria bacterium]
MLGVRKNNTLIEMTNVGTWMSHCYIAEHLQRGIMMVSDVEK